MSKDETKKQEKKAADEVQTTQLMGKATEMSPTAPSTGFDPERLAALERRFSEAESEMKELRAENGNLRDELDRRTHDLATAVRMGGAVVAPSVDAEKKQLVLAKGDAPEGYFRNARGVLVPNEFKGTRQYRAAEELFVGRLIKPDEVFNATDEQPGEHWIPLESRPAEVLQPVQGTATKSRAADRTV